jgi:putative transposase
MTKMARKKKRHSAAEISAKLNEAAALAAQGRSQIEIAETLGVSVMTFHRWRKAMSEGRQPTEIGNVSNAASSVTVPSERQARIAELQLENTRLRKLVTDLLLEKMRLEDEAHELRRPKARDGLRGRPALSNPHS